jgi:heptosyltransferase-2
MEFGLPADYAVVFPATGAYSDARAWPVEKFAELASRLDAAGLPIVVVGAADASPAAALIRTRLPSALDLTGRTTVPELVGVVGAARVVCGGDSFVGHLAAALRRPIVSIFGPSNANAWRPFARTSKRHVGLMPLSTVVSAGLPCQPCFYTGYRLGRRDGCPDRTCLRHVSVDQVTTAVLAAAGMA